MDNNYYIRYILGQTQHAQTIEPFEKSIIDICSSEGECICQIETSIICTLKGVIVAVAPHYEVLAHYDVIQGSIRKYNQFM